MASFVFVCSVTEQDSVADWKKTSYKSLSKWIAATRAQEPPLTRDGLVGFGFKLPNNQYVGAELLDEKTMRVRRALERALDDVDSVIKNGKLSVQTRARALAVVLKRRGIKISKG